MPRMSQILCLEEMSHCLLNKTCSLWSLFNSGLFAVNLKDLGEEGRGISWSQFVLSMRYPIGLFELISIALVVVQLLSCMQLFVTPWTAACPSLSPRVCPSSCPLNQ